MREPEKFVVGEVNFTLQKDFMCVDFEAEVFFEDDSMCVICGTISRQMMAGLAVDNIRSIRGFRIILRKQLEEEDNIFAIKEGHDG